jgi:transposase-like protein
MKAGTLSGRKSGVEARAVGEGGRYYVVSPGRLKCASCGSLEFRVVITEGLEPRFFCAKCNSEHVIGYPPSWRGFLEPEGGEE